MTQFEARIFLWSGYGGTSWKEHVMGKCPSGFCLGGVKEAKKGDV